MSQVLLAFAVVMIGLGGIVTTFTVGRQRIRMDLLEARIKRLEANP